MGQKVKGYKDLTKSKVMLSDFRRPHRKELMTSIFRKPNEKPPTKDHLVDIERLEKHHTNPLAAAIDQQLNHGGPLPYVLRPLIKLPPNYKAKLCDLEPIGTLLESKFDAKNTNQNELKKSKLRLNFEKCAVDLPAPIESIAEETDPKIPQISVNIDDATEGDTASLSLLLDAQEEGIAIAFQEQQNTNKSDENWQSRNVTYMLQIWEKSEGVSKLQKSKGLERKRHQTNSLMSVSSQNAPQKADSLIVQNQVNLAQDDRNTISESTLELLKRMSRDNPSDPIHNPATEHAIVHKVLTGVEPNSPRRDFVESLLLDDESKRKNESPFKSMTPGTCYKAIGNLISDNGDLLFKEYNLAHTLLGRKEWENFELIVPPFIDEENSSGQFETTPVEGPKLVKERELQNTKNSIRDRLRTMFGRKIVIPPILNSEGHGTFKPAFLKERVVPVDNINNANSLTMKRFCLLLKTLSQKESHDVFNDEEKRAIGAFLESESCRESRLPILPCIDRDIFLKCLMICLRQDQKALSLESVKLLILIEADSTLGRWDLMIFKQGLRDIMETGTVDQKQVVALYNVKHSQISSKDIQQIRLALGDLDREKRETAINILGSMPHEFAPEIVAILIEDAQHSNWRIRLDIISILEKWISRLSPNDPGPPPPRDKDALETDDDATIKALFYTLGEVGNGADLAPGIDAAVEVTQLEGAVSANTIVPVSKHEEELNEIIEGGESMEQSPEVEKTAEKAISLYYQCVHSLLNLMTSDWCVDVRIAASEAVGSLHLGNAFFEWIVYSLDSSDPVIRIDGLKCLSCIGVIHEDSLPSFLKSFHDPYASVRIQACKVALSLSCNHRLILSSLMDILDDHDHKVRAYAIKGKYLYKKLTLLALGSSKSKTAKVRECLNWAVLYDSNPIVRIEALYAAHKLGLIQEDASLRSSALTLLSSDSSERVQKEAEMILVQAGILFPNMGNGEATDQERAGKHEQRVTVDGQIVSPYPHLLLNRPPEEVEIYLRESLIGVEEVNSAIEKVGKLSSKAQVMAAVSELGGTESIGIRLDFNYK